MGLPWVIGLGSLAANAAFVVETDPTGCLDLEDLELALDEVAAPAAATVIASTSMVDGLFGVDVSVTLGSASAAVWETRIAVRRADCSSVARTVALSVQAGLRTLPAGTLGPPVRGPAEPFLALLLGAGVGSRAYEVGVRGGSVRPLGSGEMELALVGVAGLPVPILPGGAVSLVQLGGSVGVGPRALGWGPLLLRATGRVTAGAGVALGTRLEDPSAVLVGRLAPGVCLSARADWAHLGVSVAAPVPRLTYVVRGGAGSEPAQEPVLRVGAELGVWPLRSSDHAPTVAGKVDLAAGPVR